MTPQTTTNTDSFRTLLKGCGLAALVLLVLMCALLYGVWRLFKKAAANTDLTVKVGDTVKRTFAAGLAPKHFNVTASQDANKDSHTVVNSYSGKGQSLKSECLSPVAAAEPVHPENWNTPTKAQSDAIAAMLDSTLSKGLGAKYQSAMRVDTKEHLVSMFDAKTGVLCVADFGSPLPTK